MMKLRTVAAGLARGTLLGLSLLNIAIAAAVAADNEKPPQIPWDLNTLFKTPQFQPAADFDTNGVRGVFYDGLPWKGKPTRVFAFIGMPDHKAGEKVPAMVLIHGGGGTAFAKWVKFWNSRGYAAIAMDTCGSIPRGKYGDWERHENGGPGTEPGGSGRFAQIDEPIEDQWTYHAVADAILANSLLRSLPEVDKDRVGLTGISWGGFLTCIVAGLDDRFRFAAPVYGCGFIGDNSVWLPNFMGMGKEKAAKWLRYWDPSQYLPRAKIPFLWLSGSNDFAYPLDSLQKSYRSPASVRTLCIKVRMPHGHNRESENAQEICAFADHVLRNGPPLARITKQGTGDGKVWAIFEATTPITKAELNFTRDTGDGVHIRYARVANTRTWSKRTWETIPADFDAAQHKVTAAIPAGATVCYLNLIDENGLVVSTEHVEGAAGAMEGEMMRIVAKTGRVGPVDSVSQKVQNTSGGGHLWWRDGQKPGDTLTLGFTVPQPGKQRVFGRFVKGTEFGIAQLAINDEKAGEPLDFYNDGVVLTPEIELGTFDLTAGENRLAITITGANEKAVKSHMVGLDYVRFEPANQPGAATDGELRSSVEQAWRAAWDRFHHDGTHLFYDFVCSHDPDKRWSGLPTPDEARRAYPNPNGWATGMEDCAISGGLMMAMVCDRFAATQDTSLRPYAQKVFAGLVSLGTLGASDGFVIRGLCPADGKSHYPESSRDQYTWYVYGLWRYFHSPLSQPEEKTAMRRIIAAICARLERNVVAANGYRIGKDTGEFDSIVDKMWENQAHEVARLPMIYAIGADMTGDPHWQDLANRYAPEAAAKSKEESTKTPYALLQQQISLNALYALEKTPALKQQWLEAMRLVADRSAGYLVKCLDYRAPNASEVSLDWRTWPLRKGSGGYQVPTHPDSIKAEDQSIRKPAEAALTLLLCPERSLKPEQTALLRHMIAQVDSTKVVYYGHYYTQAAYWKAVTLGHIKLPQP